MLAIKEFSKKYQQDIALGASITLCLLIIITLVYVISQWHRDFYLTRTITTAVPILASNDDTTEMINAIPEAHLFGHSASNLPVTSLGIRLMGISQVETTENAQEDNTTANNNSHALISTSDNPAKSYRIGDKLPNGIKIHEIHANYIILNNDGRLEKLPLQRAPLEFKPENKKAAMVTEAPDNDEDDE